MSKQLKLPTLLIVADDPSVRFWIKKQLDDQFFILSAENKQEALQALYTRLDFIIVDAAFEDGDPLTLCKELSQFDKINRIPILLITGRLKKSFRAQATQSGVTHFLSDQLDADELQARIEEGNKIALSRQKTEDLGNAIPTIKGNSSLKKKVISIDKAKTIDSAEQAIKGKKV